MYTGDMSKEEKEELFKDLDKEKKKHLLRMSAELYKTKDFILATDNFVACSGMVEDLYILINKIIKNIITQCPESTHVWSDFFKDLSEELKKEE